MQLLNQTQSTPRPFPYHLFFFITINAKIIQIRLAQKKRQWPAGC